MIDRFRVRNFRCLRDVDVALGPLNFLIGPNNTGKSSLLDALDLLSQCVRSDGVETVFQSRGIHFDRLVTGGRRDAKLDFDVSLGRCVRDGDGHTASYSLTLGLGPRSPLIEHERFEVTTEAGEPSTVWERQAHEPARFTVNRAGEEHTEGLITGRSILWHLLQKRDHSCADLSAQLHCAPKYSLIPERMAEPCQIQPTTELASDGYGLASCLDALREEDPERFRGIESTLRQFVDRVEMVTFPTVAAGKKTILFHEAPNGYKVYAEEASDGLLLFLGYLTIAHTHGDASVLLIEEPEAGVHPRRLHDIVRLFRAMSRGELGLPPVQVIATSHSPQLLDCCDKEEIILFQRDESGAARAVPLADVKDIDEHLKDFAPGELIYTFGERICESRS